MSLKKTIILNGGNLTGLMTRIQTLAHNMKPISLSWWVSSIKHQDSAAAFFFSVS
jgi:hypothetical protein